MHFFCFSARPFAAAAFALACFGAAPLVLSGCAGGHGAQFADRADVPDAFVGVFDGGWSLPLGGRSGQFSEIAVNGKGQMSGLYTDNTRGLAGDLTGAAGADGQFFMDVKFVNNPGVDGLHFEGILVPAVVRTTEANTAGVPQAVDKEGLRGTFRQKVGETDYQGEFLIISRAPGTPVNEGGTSGGGA